MTRNGLLWILALSLWVTGVRAQLDVPFTHFWMVTPQYNPAAVGTSPMLRVIGCYSNQFAGYTDNPKTMYVGADMPLTGKKSRHAIGGHFLNDELGAFAHKRVVLQYAYGFPFLGGMLSVGLQGEVLNETLDGGKMDVEQSGDLAIPSGSINGTKLDGAAGLFFQSKRFYIGLSSLHLTAPTVTLGETNLVKVERSYYATAGCEILLNNPCFSLHPCMRWMYDGVSDRGDVAMRVQYEQDKKNLFAGAGYSPGISASLFVGGKWHGLVLSYSYEAYTGHVGLGNGAHEIVLSYEVDLNIEKKGKNYHQSVRYL